MLRDRLIAALGVTGAALLALGVLAAAIGVGAGPVTACVGVILLALATNEATIAGTSHRA